MTAVETVMQVDADGTKHLGLVELTWAKTYREAMTEYGLLPDERQAYKADTAERAYYKCGPAARHEALVAGADSLTGADIEAVVGIFAGIAADAQRRDFEASHD
jgi:hypothetical protein